MTVRVSSAAETSSLSRGAGRITTLSGETSAGLRDTSVFSRPRQRRNFANARCAPPSQAHQFRLPHRPSRLDLRCLAATRGSGGAGQTTSRPRPGGTGLRSQSIFPCAPGRGRSGRRRALRRPADLCRGEKYRCLGLGEEAAMFGKADRDVPEVESAHPVRARAAGSTLPAGMSARRASKPKSTLRLSLPFPPGSGVALFHKELPSRPQRVAIDRVDVLERRLRDKDERRGFLRHAESGEATESLPQRIETGTFGDKRIEAKIRADFETLRADENERAKWVSLWRGMEQAGAVFRRQ